MRYLIEATSLSDSELERLRRFLISLEEVEVVAVYQMHMEQRNPDRIEFLTIHAAAAPIYIAVHFMKDHWKFITGGVVGGAHVYDWLTDKIEKWNKGKKSKYVTKKIYAPDGSVASEVHIKREK